MDWHVIDAQNLAIVDREVGDYDFSPAEYELVRRVIYATADFEYKNLIHFSATAMQAGAAAIAARCTMVVDVPTIQVGILPQIQNTFANPLYCSLDAIARPQKEKTRTAWGIENLAQRYPEAIFAIGQDQSALAALIDLTAANAIKPALVIATPAGFVNVEATKKRLQEFSVPQIWTEGPKGGATVATAILEGLVELAWLAYAQEES